MQYRQRAFEDFSDDESMDNDIEVSNSASGVSTDKKLEDSSKSELTTS